MKAKTILSAVLLAGLTTSSWGFSIKPGAQVVRVSGVIVVAK